MWGKLNSREERYKGHINQSKNLANDKGTDGKLHAMLRAKGHETFKLEVLFEAQDGRVIKKLARYQQFRAVHKTLNRLKTEEKPSIQS